MEKNGIQHFEIPIPAHKDESVVIPPERIAAALKILQDSRNHPVLVHCNKGKVWLSLAVVFCALVLNFGSIEPGALWLATENSMAGQPLRYWQSKACIFPPTAGLKLYPTGTCIMLGANRGSWMRSSLQASRKPWRLRWLSPSTRPRSPGAFFYLRLRPRSGIITLMIRALVVSGFRCIRSKGSTADRPDIIDFSKGDEPVEEADAFRTTRVECKRLKE